MYLPAIANERLLFTKLDSDINPVRGEAMSRTISYYPRHKQWVSFHTILPNMLFNNRNGIYMINSTTNSGLYKLNDATTYGNYHAGTTYSATHVDICYAQPYNIDKKYVSFSWNTTIMSIVEKDLSLLTFDSLIIYNYHRHSNGIDLTLQTFDEGNVRNTNGAWHFNSFEDLLKTKTLKVVDSLDIRELQFITIDTPDLVTEWYDKSMFVDTWTIIRLIFDNSGGDGIIINGVGTTNLQPGRI